MKEIKFSTLERVILIRVMNEVQGGMRDMRKAVRILDIVELSEAEKVEIGFISLPTGAVQWTDASREWGLVFPDGNDYVFLQDQIKKYNWTGVAPRLVVGILDKFGIEDKDSD